jgi:hypothetical protein
MQRSFDLATAISITGTSIAAVVALFAIWQARSAKRQADGAQSGAEAAKEQALAAHRQADAAEQSAAAALSQLEHDREQLALSLKPRFSLVWAESVAPQWEQWEQFVLTYDHGVGELETVEVMARDGGNIDKLLVRESSTGNAVAVQSLCWNNRFPGNKMVFEAHVANGVGEVLIDIRTTMGIHSSPTSAQAYVGTRKSPVFSLQSVGPYQVDRNDDWEDWDQFVLTYDEGPGMLDTVGVVAVRGGDNLSSLLDRTSQTGVFRLEWSNRNPHDEMVFEAFLQRPDADFTIDIVATMGACRWEQSIPMAL